MNISAQKLIQCLEQFLQEVVATTYNYIKNSINISKFSDNGIFNDKVARNSMKRFITENNVDELLDTINDWIFYFKNEEAKKTNRFFNQFFYLGLILETSALNPREILNILEYIIKRNLENGIENTTDLRNQIVLGANEMLKPPALEDLNQQRMAEVYWALAAEEEQLDEESQKIVASIKNIVAGYRKNAKNLIQAHVLFSKHYIEKKMNFDEADVEQITKAFQLLELREELIKPLKIILLNKVEKQKKKVAISYKKTNQAVKSDENRITQQEYNRIFHEIKKYYDIQNQKVLRPLTLDEILYIVHLLFKIQLPKSEIIKCVRNINREGLYAYDNPLSQFNAYYNKMITLSENAEINESLNYILECMKALYIPEEQSDYLFWKKEVENELKKVMKILNQDYEYEIEEGRKLVVR